MKVGDKDSAECGEIWKVKGKDLREEGECNKEPGYHGKFRARKKEPRCQANQSRAFIEQIGQ